MISSSRILFDVVMDAALFLIAGNETCSQPQTSEHFARVEIMKLGSIHILQNKVDLIRLLSTKAIVARSPLIVPLCNRNTTSTLSLQSVYLSLSATLLFDPSLIRSFDVNKPGAEVRELKAGVAGGFIFTGPEPRKPVSSRIVSLHAENNRLQLAVSGGLIGIPTKFDPTLCRADRLVGQVLGAIEKLPKVYTGEHARFGYVITF
ncbi:translation protein [Suillus tomentosus]|nr:translation protein [Suillus tomentosus]